MSEDNLPTRSEEELDDPFDLDIHVYLISKEERQVPEAANSTELPFDTTMGNCTSPGCG